MKLQPKIMGLLVFLMLLLGGVQQVQGYACKASGDCGSSSDPGRNSCGIKSTEKRYCPSEGDTCSGSTTYICDGVCSNRSWTANWSANGVDSCGGSPNNPPPTQEAIVLGRVYSTNTSCPNGQDFYGTACGVSTCSSGPNYQVTWSKNGTTETTNSSVCGGGAPLYTFENAKKPASSATGEKVTLSIAVQGSDVAKGLTHWARNTTNSAGQTCKPSESGTFAGSGLNQSLELTVYADNDCKWNHVWFYSVPQKKVSGCFFDAITNQKIDQTTTPPVEIFSPTRGSSFANLINGCFTSTTDLFVGEGYAVRPHYGAPTNYQAPAQARNTTQSLMTCNNPPTHTPSTYPSYECQQVGNQDCGESCDFSFQPKPPETVPDCTNLSGPTTLDPGQKGTYQVTAGGSAPISSVELSAYSSNCTTQVRPYAPQNVPGAGIYSFDWTAPTTPGLYTLYGRVWNSNIAECRADCVDKPPRYLCASAQQCKKTVTVGTPKSAPTVSCAPTGTEATFSWRAVPGAKRYVLRIDKVNSCASSSSGWFCGPNEVNPRNPNQHGEDQYVLLAAADVCTDTSCSIIRPVVANAEYLTASIQWVETETGTVVADGARIGSSSSFNCPDPTNQRIHITGTIREGSALKYGPNSWCADASKPPIATQGTLALSGSPTSTYNLSGATTYSFDILADPVGSTRELRLSGLTSSGLLCSCQSGCTYTIPTDTPGTYSYDFFVSKFTSLSWWQVAGGHVFSNTGLASNIPATCSSPDCSPFLVLKERFPYSISAAEQKILSAGIPIGPDNATGTGNKTERSNQHTNAKLNPPQPSPKEDYNYFAQKVALPNIPAQTGATVREVSQLGATTKDGVLIAHFTGELVIDPTSPWVITGGNPTVAKKYLIFADSVVIKDTASLKKLITIEEGGFFMLLSKGNITIDSTVGDTPLNKTINLEGVYLADGALTIESDNNNTTQDLQFIGAGSFISWTNVTLKRQFADSGSGALQNNTSPAEFFIFRPDLIKNVPTVLKDTKTIWREIN